MLARRAGSPLTHPSPTTTRPAGQPEPGTWRIASWGLAATLVTTALSYVFQILVARFMSPRSYSETVAMLSLYMVCTLPMAPIFLLVTRRVVDARLRGADADTRTLLLALARTIGLASVVGAALVFVARVPLAAWLHVSDPSTPPIFAISVGVSALYLLAVAVLLGRVNWLMANSLPVLLGTTRILFSLLFVRPGFEVSGTFTAITASAVLCLAIGLVAALRGLPTGGQYRPLHVGEVGLAITVNLAFWFLVQIDTLYVNRALPLVSERYAAASALGKMLVYVPVAVGNVLFPLLTAARPGPERRAVIVRMIVLVIVLDAIGYTIMAAAPERLLLLTLGETHVAAMSLLVRVAAVLAPFALASVFMYEALARHDRGLTTIFAVTAAGAAVALAVSPPSLPALFTILLTAAAVTILGGFVRSAGRVALDRADTE
jgi:hypothetical protein